ncbi:2-hydroxyacyl-CoA dehydratase subunit D [Chloroflexota bacterium]
MVSRKYEAKPFECWQKAKELTAKHYAGLRLAKEQKKLIICGELDFMPSLTAGLGDFELLHPAICGAATVYKPELAMACFEGLDARGYNSTEMCAVMGLQLGSMFIDSGAFGEVIRPDICIGLNSCPNNSKATQIISEYYGIPVFNIDLPLIPRTQRKEFHRQYLVSQMQNAIEWMEKITGRRYDDEMLAKAVCNEWEATVLWARICDLNKAIPAPLDLKLMYAFCFPAIVGREKVETVEFYRILLDEMEERVKNQIAAVATERCRLLHEGIPPAYFPHLFKIAESYGVAFVGSESVFADTGAFSVTEDGSWVPANTLEENGIYLRTRDDALNALADLYLSYYMSTNSHSISSRVEDQLKRVQDWHADGVVFHYDHGCKSMPAAMPEARLALKERGVPTMVYEANSSDQRQFSEVQVVNLFDSFFESMGLCRLAS